MATNPNKKLKTDSNDNYDNVETVKDLGDFIQNKDDNSNYQKLEKNEDLNKKICIHICEKKKRQCKFYAIKNSDYCVEHVAFNKQLEDGKIDKRIICPLDPKHSVYEKNFAKHLKKCNSRIRTLGEYDIKGINLYDDLSLADLNNNDKTTDNDNNNNNNNTDNKLDSSIFSTYKELDEFQLKQIVDFIIDLDAKLSLTDLDFNKLENRYLNKILNEKNDDHKKHIKQISSIISHLDVLFENLNEDDYDDSQSTLLCELGAGRGKLSYWFEKARNHCNESNNNKKINILLIERGAQRLKFDSLLKKELEDNQAEFERMRIDLKDLYLNKVPLVEKSSNFILYGKHLCGVATDYAIRCMKHSLDNYTKQEKPIKLKGLVLAVCCHHQCVYDSFCGKEYLKQAFNIDSKLFYILRSISSWRTSTTSEEILFGHEKPKLGRICKNLFDYARMQYMLTNIKLPSGYFLKPKLFYYIEPDVTLENTLLYVSIEKSLDKK